MEKIDSVLLLGSKGQIGSNLKKKLKIISKKNTTFSKREFNLENLASIKKKLNKVKPKLIINAAAYTKVDEAEVEKKKCFKINVSSSKLISEWAKKNNCFFIHYSTVYIFDGKKKTPWKENDKPNPLNYYGQTKLTAEKEIIKSKCNYLILRLNWIYNENGENFPKKIIQKFNKSEKLFLVNNQIGTPNHAEFISDITIKIIKKILNNNINPKILNISAKGKSNYYDFGKKIFKKIKNKNKFPKLEAIDAKNYKKIFKNNKTAVRPINSLLNVQKLEKFIDQKMPDWNYIFERKINKIIKKYSI